MAQLYSYKANYDSDSDIISGNVSDNEIVVKGYVPLREDVETVIIHHKSDDDTQSLNEAPAGQCKSGRLLLSTAVPASFSQELVSLNSSCDKLFTRERRANGMPDIKKSKSANFQFRGSMELKSPSLVQRRSEVPSYKFEVPNNKSKIINSAVIYDYPKRFVEDCDDTTVEVNDVKLKVNSPTFSITPLKSTIATKLSVPPSSPLSRAPLSLLPLSHAPPSSTTNSGISRFLEEKFKCHLCRNAFADPRTLECLHSFCGHCLIELEAAKNGNTQYWAGATGSDNEWPSCSASGSVGSHENGNVEDSSRSSRTVSSNKGLVRRKSSVKAIKGRSSSAVSYSSKPKSIACPRCEHLTELPIGGIGRLPRNYVLARQTHEALSKIGSEQIGYLSFCDLCNSEVEASFFCTSCNFSICGFCKEAHLRQRITSTHKIRNIDEIRKNSTVGGRLEIARRKVLKCPIHINYELKLFCTTCNQVACSDCTILIHRGHKCEPIAKASKLYIKIVKNALDKTRPVTDYANHTITKLNGLTKKINRRCDTVQTEVDTFLAEYFEALELHRTTLLNQISRARNNKMEMIKTQQTELERRSRNAQTAIEFTEDLLSDGSDIEVLTFVGILLQRFEQCQKSGNSDEKITDSLQFLPDVRAPSMKPQDNIPLFGIITTQTAVPKHSTLDTSDLMNLRVHRKADLVVVSKDSSEQALCHGGLALTAELKYKDSSQRQITHQIIDKRDGTYRISFIPDAPGLITIAIAIQGKQIKGSPYTLCARNLRPHSGIYHCCTFCSSGGSKTIKCGCEGVMAGGYKGCGHGHEGHPGRRHWSCCANVLENSECSKANAVIIPT